MSMIFSLLSTLNNFQLHFLFANKLIEGNVYFVFPCSHFLVYEFKVSVTKLYLIIVSKNQIINLRCSKLDESHRDHN